MTTEKFQAWNHEEFQALLQRVRDGCQQAAADLFRDYDTMLRCLVRRHLGQPLRRLNDSADVVQVAWLHFFNGPAHTQHFDSPNHLLAFLFRLARNHLANLQDSLVDCQKRDLRRDQSLAEPETQTAADQTAAAPSPVAAIERRDEWEQALSRLPPECQQALRMLRAGHSSEEVAAVLGVSARTAQRMLERTRSAPVTIGLM